MQPDEGLRKWLDNYLETHSQITVQTLARRRYIGASRTAIEWYLDGYYFLPKGQGGLGVDPGYSQLERRVRAFRDRVETN